MSIIAVLVVMLAVAIYDMIVFYRAAEDYVGRPSRAFIMVLLVGVVQATVWLLSLGLGDIISAVEESMAESYRSRDAYTMLAMVVIVAIRVAFPYLRRNKQPQHHSLNNRHSVLLLSFSLVVNVLLLGLGIGFVVSPIDRVGVLLWIPMAMMVLLSYLGVMFGHGKVALRCRRWVFISAIIMVVAAIIGVVQTL